MDTPKITAHIAPTDGMASKKQIPHLPLQPDEIANAAHDWCNAGASPVAVHAHNRQEGLGKHRDARARSEKA